MLHKLSLAIVTALALLTAYATAVQAARTADLYNPAPIAVPAKATPAQVKTAIKIALQGRGWTHKEQAPGHIVATLVARKHEAKVDIRYDAREITIKYLDSVELNYEKTSDGEIIHQNYNGWIKNLERDIQAHLNAEL